MKIDVVQLELRKAYQLEIETENDIIYNASYAAPVFCKAIGSLNVEHTAMLTLDNTDRIVNYFVISMGEISSVKVSLAQLFRCALLSNASKIIIAHNHPSGILEITSKDIEMTKKIGFLAGLFSIDLIDSLVVNEKNYVSIRAHCKEYTDD